MNILLVSMDFDPLDLPKLTALMNVMFNIPQILHTCFFKMREVD